MQVSGTILITVYLARQTGVLDGHSLSMACLGWFMFQNLTQQSWLEVANSSWLWGDQSKPWIFDKWPAMYCIGWCDLRASHILISPSWHVASRWEFRLFHFTWDTPAMPWSDCFGLRKSLMSHKCVYVSTLHVVSVFGSNGDQSKSLITRVWALSEFCCLHWGFSQLHTSARWLQAVTKRWECETCGFHWTASICHLLWRGNLLMVDVGSFKSSTAMVRRLKIQNITRCQNDMSEKNTKKMQRFR